MLRLLRALRLALPKNPGKLNGDKNIKTRHFKKIDNPENAMIYRDIFINILL